MLKQVMKFGKQILLAGVLFSSLFTVTEVTDSLDTRLLAHFNTNPSTHVKGSETTFGRAVCSEYLKCHPRQS